MTKLSEAGGDAERYTIHKDRNGLHCTCMDNIARREPAGTLCKHISALAAMGLLSDTLA